VREWKDNNLLNEKLRNSDYIKIIEENLMNVQIVLSRNTISYHTAPNLRI